MHAHLRAFYTVHGGKNAPFDVNTCTNLAVTGL